MDDQEYASESDQSDEDFCPENEEQSDVSVEESDGDSNVSKSGEENSDDENTGNKKTKKKRKTKPKSKKKNKTTIVDRKEEKNKSTNEDKVDDETKSVDKKDEKKRADALWADFLKDVDTTQPKSTAAGSSSSSTAEVPQTKPEKVKITQVFDFAGEDVKVEKEVTVEEMKKLSKIGGITAIDSSDSSSVNPPTSKAIPLPRTPFPMKRPANRGGVAAVLQQIGKKPKMSVFEKTKLDWENFKQKEGIDEELATFNKGKDGYLEKQEFLHRTDLRQFEIEKELRNANRSRTSSKR